MINYSTHLVKKLVGVFFLWSLFLLPSLSAEVAKDWSTSLKPCWEKKTEINYNHLLASDNERIGPQVESIGILFSDQLITGINSANGNSIWEIQIAGNIIYEPKILGNNIILLSSPKNTGKSNLDYKTENETVFLTSISILSGLTNWKVKFPFTTKIFTNIEKDEIYTIDEKNRINLVNITNGEIIWSKNFTSKIKSAIALNHRIFVSTENGEIVIISSKERGILITKNIKSILLDNNISSNGKEVDKNIFLNDENGNIANFDLDLNKVIWQRKIGGKVSNLNFYKNTLLISSFDNFIYLFNVNTGKLLLKKRLDGRIIDKTSQKGNIIAVSAYGSFQISFFDLKVNKAINVLALSDASLFVEKFIISGNYLIVTTPKYIKAFSFDC